MDTANDYSVKLSPEERSFVIRVIKEEVVDPLAIARANALWLVNKGQSLDEAEHKSGLFPKSSINRLIDYYKQFGICAALYGLDYKDFTEAHKEYILRIVKTNPAELGLEQNIWTQRTLSQYIAEHCFEDGYPALAITKTDSLSRCLVENHIKLSKEYELGSVNNIQLSEDEIEFANRYAKGINVHRNQAKRARVMLLANQGMPPIQMASEVGLSLFNVRTILNSYSTSKDIKYVVVGTIPPGNGIHFTIEEKNHILKRAEDSPRDAGFDLDDWTVQALVEYVHKSADADGYPNLKKISNTTVRQICNDNGIKFQSIRRGRSKADESSSNSTESRDVTDNS